MKIIINTPKLRIFTILATFGELCKFYNCCIIKHRSYKKQIDYTTSFLKKCSKELLATGRSDFLEHGVTNQSLCRGGDLRLHCLNGDFVLTMLSHLLL